MIKILDQICSIYFSVYTENKLFDIEIGLKMALCYGVKTQILILWFANSFS